MERSFSIPRKVIARGDWEQNLSRVVISKNDMNKLIMNFLITKEFVAAAEKFMMESGTEPDSCMGETIDRIVAWEAIQNGNPEKAIWKVNDMNPEILKRNPLLFFRLQQQRFIELIREGKVKGALEFSQKELVPIGEKNPEFLEELERTISLLAFDNPSNSPVQDLYSDLQRQKTAIELNAAILLNQRHRKDPKLPHLLRLLVRAQNQLHEKASYPHITDFINATLEDPVFDTWMAFAENKCLDGYPIYKLFPSQCSFLLMHKYVQVRLVQSKLRMSIQCSFLPLHKYIQARLAGKLRMSIKSSFLPLHKCIQARLASKLRMPK